MKMPQIIRMRFGFVLWSGFLSVLAIMMIQGGMATWSLSHIEQRNAEAIENVTQLVEQVREIQHDSQEAAEEVVALSDDVRTGLTMHMSQGSQDLAVLQRAVERLVQSSRDSLEELEEMLDDPDLDEMTIGIIEDVLFTVEDSGDAARKECLPTVRSVVASLSKGIESADDTAVRIVALESTMSRFSETSRAVVAMGDAAEKVSTDSLVQAQHAKKTIAVALGVGLVVGFIIPFLIVRRTTRPLRSLIESIRDIAEGEGDLTKRLNMSRTDEIGELAGWFDAFVARIHGIISDVSCASGQVAAASTEIAASSDEMSHGLQNQAMQIQQISAAIEEMSCCVVEVAGNANDATENAREAGEAARTGGAVVASTVEGMGEISEAVGSSATSVTELGRKSEQIGEIIAVINDIADQTNLLALNAAIEAARAGEQGRGFAVVADEVRKLAERTTQATEEVGHSIRDIQLETSKAVKLINAGTTRVEAGVVQANEAGETLGKIVESSHSLEQLISSIAKATEEQSLASGQIAEGIEQINTVTHESNQGASQTAEAASNLSHEAERLQELVGQFKL